MYYAWAYDDVNPYYCPTTTLTTSPIPCIAEITPYANFSSSTVTVTTSSLPGYSGTQVGTFPPLDADGDWIFLKKMHVRIGMRLNDNQSMPTDPQQWRWQVIRQKNWSDSAITNADFNGAWDQPDFPRIDSLQDDKIHAIQRKNDKYVVVKDSGWHQWGGRGIATANTATVTDPTKLYYAPQPRKWTFDIKINKKVHRNLIGTGIGIPFMPKYYVVFMYTGASATSPDFSLTADMHWKEY